MEPSGFFIPLPALYFQFRPRIFNTACFLTLWEKCFWSFLSMTFLINNFSWDLLVCTAFLHYSINMQSLWNHFIIFYGVWIFVIQHHFWALILCFNDTQKLLLIFLTPFYFLHSVLPSLTFVTPRGFPFSSADYQEQ